MRAGSIPASPTGPKGAKDNVVAVNERGEDVTVFFSSSSLLTLRAEWREEKSQDNARCRPKQCRQEVDEIVIHEP